MKIAPAWSEMNSLNARTRAVGTGLFLLVNAFLPLAASGQAPSIALQSPSETVIAGQCASFAVGANGSPAPTYQWQQSTDGGNTWTNLTEGNGMIGTGTATLVIAEATVPMSGSQFQALVANASGSAASAPVALTVTPLPVGDVVAYNFGILAGMAPGSADGTGGSARFLNPGALALDAVGNAYVADSGNSTIRKITPSGVVTTLAGSPGNSGAADGTGGAARFNGPQGVAVDGSGNVYVADTGNNTIRKITPGGVVTTLAGAPPPFAPAGLADGQGRAARFNGPWGVAVDGSGNVLVADTGNFVIRRITPAGAVTSVTSGGNGYLDGNGSSAAFDGPKGVAVDSAGNLYVADTGNDVIRKIASNGVVTTLAGSPPTANVVNGMAPFLYHPGSADGTGGSAQFNGPQGVSVDSAGNVYVADTGNNTVRKITPAGAVTTLAGSPPSPPTKAKGSSILLYNPAGSYGSADGTGSGARFANLFGIAVDGAGNLYVADTGNNTIRKVTPAGAVATLAGTAVQGGDNGTVGAAQFFYPQGAAVDIAGNLYVADSYNHAIRKITPGGSVTTLAGTVGMAGSTDGTGGAALFNCPSGVAVDGTGNVYVADTHNDTIRKITPAGVVTTLAGSPGNAGYADGTGSAAQFFYPWGVAVDGSGYVYVADHYNDAVRKVTPAGVVTTLAGGPLPSGGSDTAPPFNLPSGVALDSSGNVYVADLFAIQRVAPGGTVATLAGNEYANMGGISDGLGSVAQFNGPQGLAIDGAGNVYVADTGNNLIRKITPGGFVTTIAGSPDSVFATADGVGGAAQFNGPCGIAVDGSGTLYVAESQLAGNPMAPPTTESAVSDIRLGIPLAVELPAITSQPQSQTVNSGDTVTLAVAASGNPPPAYQWEFGGMPIAGATGPTLTLSNVGATQAGVYSVLVTARGFTALSNAAVVTVGTRGWLANLSARAYVAPTLSPRDMLIAGFVTAGPGAKSVLARGAGPGLQQFGVTGFISNPSLTIYSGSTPGLTLTSWNPNLAAMFTSLGAFPFAVGSNDTAALQSFSPGAYTAVVSSASTPAANGIALAELYDADQGAPSNRLVNLSARAYVGLGANILIGGFIVGGPSSETVLVRGVGPGLGSLNLSGFLAEPLLAVYDSNPTHSASGPQLIAQIQGWGGPPMQGASAVAARIEPATASDMSQAGAFSLTAGSADSAMVLTLPPGAYTAEVSGADGGSGIALVEIYELP
jgi:sugar lactone lactonase YvrE